MPILKIVKKKLNFAIIEWWLKLRFAPLLVSLPQTLERLLALANMQRYAKSFSKALSMLTMRYSKFKADDHKVPVLWNRLGDGPVWQNKKGPKYFLSGIHYSF